ncbi:hypothetical protein [Paludisphaera rhizosphaerae]|uniref:hypothetical protein n=1 Tax=Paludisphaera rhizosphaerae TaxID=2711216 RepID=UPI0013EC6BA7|nr:hypothetical protein [Paludisphaera rhizosphaerae]
MDASRSRQWRRVLAMLLFLIPAAASLGVLGLRVATVVGPLGFLDTTTSGESVQLLNVMKLQRGLPLYDHPVEPPFYPLAMHNIGFYKAYAWAVSTLGSDAEDLARGARLFTLALAAMGLGAALAYGLIDLRRRDPRLDSPWVAPTMVLAALATWFGGLPGWWVVSIRPDIGGAAFAAVGLTLALAIGPRREILAGLAAGATLAVAWTFKQSCILTWGGLMLSALVMRRWRFAAAVAAPLVATVAGVNLLLGPDYRYNTMFAVSLAGFDFHNITNLSIHLAIKGILPLTIAALALAGLRGASWLRADEKAALACCAGTTLMGGLAACYRNGSAMNYFFEFNAVAGLLAVVLGRRLVEVVAERGHVWALAAVAAAGLGATAQDVVRVVAPSRFDLVHDRFDVGRRAELDRARGLLQKADGPVYCQPALSGLTLGLPFPVYNFDDEPFFHRPAAQRGLLKGDGVAGQVLSRYFRVIVAEPENDYLLSLARQAGYVEREDWKYFHVLTSPDVSTALAR